MYLRSIMCNLVLVTVVLAAVCGAMELPCPEGGCKNTSFYVGPRWWSKTILFPNYPKGRSSSEEEENRFISETETERAYVRGSEYYIRSETERPWAQRRPVPDDNSVMMEYHGQPSTRIPGYTKSAGREEGVVLNYIALGLGGDEVKKSLSQLSKKDSELLRRLYLGYNNIRYLPVLTFPVELEYGLQELRLDHNPLNYLPSYTRFELSRLGNLKVLSLAGTGLQYLDSLYIPSLRTLDFSNNQLSFPPSCLESMPRLQNLDLSYNRISSLYDSSLNRLTGLFTLNLSHNHLSYISENVFKSMYVLQKLHLSNNSLTSLPDFSGMSVHARLTLSRNPWECSCQLLAAYNTYPVIEDRETLTCLSNYHHPRLVGSLTEEGLEVKCHPAMNWLKAWALRTEQRVNWFFRHVIRLSTLLVWSLLIVVLLLLVRFVRRARNKKALLELPYNVLDDKMVVA